MFPFSCCRFQKSTKSTYTTLKKDKRISSVEINEPLKVNKATTTKDKSEKTTEKTELGKYLDSLKPSKEVRVAILDTGLNAKEGLNVEDLGINYSSTGESTSSNDDNGHGTEMAELISANSSSVKLVPIKVADSSGKATILNTYLGIKKAIELGVDVVNISMNTASTTTSEILTEAINEAVNSGIFVVVSAGNLGLDTSKVSPANVDSAIVVSAVNSDNTFANYSNYGNTIDYSAYGTYNGKTGTSYATARVSGIVADLLSKQGSLETLDKYAVDLGAEGKDPQFGKGLLTLETLQGSDEEDEADKIAKENKEKYEKLCANWKGMTDEELDSALEGLSETLRGFFLRELSESELADVLGKDTLLVRPLDVTKAIIVDSVEDIPDTVEKEPEVKSYDKAYKYYLELTEDLEISDTARVWTNGGEFYFNFSGADSSSASSYNGKITVTLTNIDFNYAKPGANDSILSSGKDKGNTVNVSWSGSVTGFALGTPYLVRQDTSNTSGAKTDWTGIYLVNMKLGIPQYHKIDDVNPVNVEPFKSRFSFYKWKSDATGTDVSSDFVGKIKDSASTVTTYFQANAYNIGLDNARGEHHATMNIVYKRPTYTITYYRNRYHTDEKSDTKTYKVTGVKRGTNPKAITASKAGFTKPKYNFSTWKKGSRKGTAVAANANIGTITGNVKMYASWVKAPTPTPAKVYKSLTYHSNYPKDSGEETGTEEYAEGTVVEVDDVDVWFNTPSGYAFKYWSRGKADGTGTIFDPDKGATITMSSNANLYAVWEPDHNLIVNPNGGTFIDGSGKTHNNTTWSKKFSYNTTTWFCTGIEDFRDGGVNCCSLPTRAGYKFIGWKPSVGTVDKCKDEAEGDGFYWDFHGNATSDVTVTAQWSPYPKLVVDPDGGTFTDGSGVVHNGTTWTKVFEPGQWDCFSTTDNTYSSALNSCSIPTKEGYRFVEWKKVSGNGSIGKRIYTDMWDFKAPDPTTTTAEVTTVKAIYEAIPEYTVTYEYYKETSNGWNKFASEQSTMSEGTALAFTTISAKSDAKYEAEKNGELKGYGSTPEIHKGMMSGESITSDLTLTSNITICIGYSNSSNKLVIDVKGGKYNTAAGTDNTNNMNLDFTYGSVKNFSSNDIANYVEGGMSLPTKAYNHLYGDTSYVVSSNERYRYDASYANAKGIDSKYRTYWTIVQGDSTGSVVNNGGNYAFNGQSLSNVKIQANWIPNQYQIKLDLQGGTYNGKINGEAMYNDTLVEYYGDCWGFVNYSNYGVTLLSGTNPGTGLDGYNVKKTDYVFGGFYTGTNGTGSPVIDANGVIQANNTKFTSDTTIYAYWVREYVPTNTPLPTVTPDPTKEQYPVICYDVVDSASGIVLGMHTENYNYGSYVRGSYWGSDTRLGAYHSGYKYKDDTSAYVTTAGATVYRIFYKPESNLTIDPNGGTWRGKSTTTRFTGKTEGDTEYIEDPVKNCLTAYFDPNGGTCTTRSIDTYVKFNYWSKSYSFTAGTFNESTKIFTFGSAKQGDGTMTAIYNENKDIKLPEPTWAGHDFVGWYTAPTGGRLVGVANDTVTLSSNVTYYAQWKAHPTKITLSNMVDKSKVAFAKGNPVAVFKVEGTDVMGDKHTFIKTLKWDTTSNNYQSLSFTILSGNYTVTLINQNEYAVGTPSGTSNVSASGTTASVNMSDGSEATVNFTTSENDYSKYTGNSLVTTSLK